ncbi:MAG: exosome complex RNA-binding protein Csl4 [Methanomassiliicoccales archaeon]
MEKRLVVTGDVVAMAEEYAPGRGTFESDGKLVASLTGTLLLDPQSHTASVLSRNPITEPKKKDRVIAVITDLKSSMAICEILTIEGARRSVTGETEATLHVSNISPQYVDSISSAVRVGDVIRAEVIQTTPSIQLSTVARPFGVILARCSRCRSPLKLKQRQLYCEDCERFEKRKIGEPYSFIG